jgi:hypothetical protein
MSNEGNQAVATVADAAQQSKPAPTPLVKSAELTPLERRKLAVTQRDEMYQAVLENLKNCTEPKVAAMLLRLGQQILRDRDAALAELEVLEQAEAAELPPTSAAAMPSTRQGQPARRPAAASPPVATAFPRSARPSIADTPPRPAAVTPGYGTADVGGNLSAMVVSKATNDPNARTARSS